MIQNIKSYNKAVHCIDDVNTKLLSRKLCSTFAVNVISICAFTGILVTSQHAHAEIYKVVNTETGAVSYTDQPQLHINKPVTVEPIKVSSGANNTQFASSSNSNLRNTNRFRSTNTRTVTQVTNATSAQNMTPSMPNLPVQEFSKVGSYRVNIISPAEERAYHRFSQSIDVNAEISPRLQKGDEVQMLIDGHLIAESAQEKIPTDEIVAGPHTLTIQVVNQEGIQVASDSMPFHIIQRNLAIQHQRQQAAAKARYDALPWYKKLYLALTRK